MVTKGSPSTVSERAARTGTIVGRRAAKDFGPWKKMRNTQNVLLALAVPLPSILFCYAFVHDWLPQHMGDIWKWCSQNPLMLLNALFFINVDVIFWVISLFQGSTWLIDLYWTVLPVMMAHFYAAHPNHEANICRSRVAIVLTWLWSIRLTHSYFRREEWQWGAREDWRFAQMRKQYGKHWSWISFFVVYLSQQIFLVGICLPLYTIHSSQKPWNSLDFLATSVCITGIVLAYFADTQLYSFVKRKTVLKELGVPGEVVLDKGLWRYSRHPNYFGEQLWWWGLVIFAWNVGQGRTFIGTAVNSGCLAYVTVLVEKKMLADETRAKEYRKYQQETSVWIPWFKAKKSLRRDGKED